MRNKLGWILVISVVTMSFMTSESSNESDSIMKVPKGTIIAWSPEAAGTSECPAGWKIANGIDGTPDLRKRFLLGSEIGDSGKKLEYNLGHSRGHDGDIYAYYNVPSFTIVYIIKL